jgi:hypothetical protein
MSQSEVFNFDLRLLTLNSQLYNSELSPLALEFYNPPAKMASSFEETLVEVWRQVLVDNAPVVVLGEQRYPVRQTRARKLRQVDFVVEGNRIRGLEQNPQTNSRWAQMARRGKKVMQFLIDGRYVANAVEGKVTLYRK